MNNNESRTSLQMSMVYRYRDLWRQYILWTRVYIINVACGYGVSPYLTQRMTQNSEDIAYEFRRYYEYENSKIFELLLNKQFFVSANLLNAAKAGDTELTEVVRTEWYHNVDEIADFFARVNPNWSKEEWQKILYEHLVMLENEGTCAFMTKYDADVKNYEVIENQSMVMADYMADGIIKQFNI
ncbi:MAG: hypothetical protein ACYCWE_20845 [Eubacteriales bacterium]